MPENPHITLDESQKRAFELVVHNRHQNVSIQGQAGTGKSTLINFIRDALNKQKRQLVVAAPTGIAAELVKGSTIHSLFKLGGLPYFPLDIVENYQRFQDVVKHIDTLIIDEASMLRADIFDTINILCKRAKEDTRPFGGIQIVLIGDLYQLPPVYKNNHQEAEKYLLKTYGNSAPFFFDAQCYAEGNFKLIELTTNHRQNNDNEFISHLRTISKRDIDNIEEALNYFNQRVHDEKAPNNVSIVTATRSQANDINEQELNKLLGPVQTFTASASGLYFEEDSRENRIKNFHIPYQLELKKGARVMLCKNSPLGLYVNGSMGEVEGFAIDEITVKLDNKQTIKIQKENWYIEEYIKNANNQLEKHTIGTFTQYPLKLAYAITIHKSQGQTWDNVCIDLGDSRAFAPGQVYVALSRVRTIQGVYLKRPLTKADILSNPQVENFLNRPDIVYPLSEDSKQETNLASIATEKKPEILNPIAAKIRVSRISSYQGNCTAQWTIDNNELENDLYLQAGKRDIIKNNRLAPNMQIHIYKIKGGSYSIDDFEHCVRDRFRGRNNGINETQRDIQINIDTHRETLKGRVDFSKHLWLTIDYQENRIFINPII